MSSDSTGNRGTAAEMVLLEAWVYDNPGSQAALKLAAAFIETQRPAEAREILGKYLALHPANVQARELLARVLEQRGDRDGAAAQLLLAAQELGRHAVVFSHLARLLDEQGREKEAAKARVLAEALETGIGPLPSFDGLESATMANIYAAQGHSEQAEEIYKKLLARQPGDVEVGAKLAATQQKTALDQGGKVIQKLNRFKQAAMRRAAGAAPA